MGAQPPNSVNFLELRAYMNRYSVTKGYFRFKKLWRNHYITRYRVVEIVTFSKGKRMPMQRMKDQMKHKLTAKKFGTLNIGVPEVPEVPEKGQRLIVTGQSLGRRLMFPFSMG